MARFLWVVVLALLWCLPGCQPQAPGSDGTGVTAQPQGMLPDLPAPSALKAPAEIGSGLFRYGDEYESLKPHQRVRQMDGDTALFTPDWQGQASGLAGLAYAIYFLDATGYEPTSLWFDWALEGEREDLWIGLPSPDDSHWDWTQPGWSQTVDFNKTGTFNDPGDYFIVLCTGRDAWRLNNVRLFDELAPPHIVGVTPLVGEAGSIIQLNLEFRNTIGQCTWDFGGGAVPLDPLFPHSGIILGPAGTYQAQVTAYNLAGESTYNFTLTVTGASELYSLSGTLRQPGGLPFAWGGVEVVGPTSSFAYSDAQGRYTAVNLLPGDYTVIPFSMTFTPYQREVTISNTDLAGLDFQVIGGYTQSIHGRVRTLPDLSSAPGVTLQLTGPVNRTVVTDSDGDGSYWMQYLPAGTYTITAVEPGFFFAPASAVVVLAGDGYDYYSAECNFLRSDTPITTYSLGGTVTDFDNGMPLAGLAVELSGLNDATAYTAADGTYTFSDVPSYPLSLRLATPNNLWDGIPANYSFTPDADRNDLDFKRKER